MLVLVPVPVLVHEREDDSQLGDCGASFGHVVQAQTRYHNRQSEIETELGVEVPGTTKQRAEGD